MQAYRQQLVIRSRLPTRAFIFYRIGEGRDSSSIKLSFNLQDRVVDFITFRVRGRVTVD